MEKRYIKQLDLELSPLGFGIMRLPMDGDDFPKKVYELIDQAMAKGINYYDTAYLYQKSKSEILIREALVKRYDKNSFYIADKLPVWECQNQDDMERIFQIQMERLGVDRIDFYLLHALHKNIWESVYEKGVLDFLERKKREGRIGKVGFSFHDTTEVLKQIEQTYSWDFIQLQLNYYDWEVNGVKNSYAYLEKRNIPCIVMEPVGGGRLSELPREAEEKLKTVHPDQTVSSWAIRYAASLPDVAVTLSGMSNEIQLNDNAAQFGNIRPFTREENEAINQVVDIIVSRHSVPCSGCRYCVDECPKGVDIPQIFKRYNDFYLFEKTQTPTFDEDYFMYIPEDKTADMCIKCQKCSQKCPQKIDIPRKIEEIHKLAISLTIGMEDPSELDVFLQQHIGKKVICFGAGLKGIRTKRFLEHVGYEVAYFCDNAESKWGSFADKIEIVSPAGLNELYKDGKYCVLITSAYHEQIKAQLINMGRRIGADPEDFDF